MSRKRISMKKLKEVYRLKFELGYSNRLIGTSVNISPGTVSEYLSLFKAAKLSWSEVANLADEVLEKLVYRHPEEVATKSVRAQPNWADVHLELRRKGVTLLLLWREYKDQHPNGLGYTQFCKLYRAFSRTVEPVMRLTHKAGEKTFVDYSGLKMEWINPGTGEIHETEIFVGCLGASQLIFAEATATQSTPDWIASHVRMFETFGGVSEILIPDNLKAGIHKAHRYDPDLNQTYAALAQHYGIAIIPTRIFSPRDKAKVENAVQCVEREIIAPLRHRTFTSLEDINNAIKLLLEKLNNRSMKRINLSRQQQFEQLEKTTLKPLPLHRFELQEWSNVKVHIDYHISVNKHYYSIPYRLIGQYVNVCIMKSRLEIFHQSQRVALHIRDDKPYCFTTLEEHMPPQHRYYQQEEKEASIVWLLSWAKNMGESSYMCVDKFFQVRPFPQQAIRAVLGLKRLAERFGKSRFEEACKQCLVLNSYRVKTVENILRHDLDKTQPSKTTKNIITQQEYFRGAQYYQ